MPDTKKLEADDAVRLLRNAIHKVRYFAAHGEGLSPACKTHGELILQDALEYLAWGDTHNARALMAVYERWLETGEAPWPFDPNKPPPSALPPERDTDRNPVFIEDPGGGVWHESDCPDDLKDDFPF